MNKIAILLAVMLAFPAVFAFDVMAPVDTFTVSTLTTKQIDIPVKSDFADTIRANIIESKTWVTLGASQLQFQPGETKNFSIYVSPFIDTVIIPYKISVLFESSTTKELKKGDIFVSVYKGQIVNLDRIVVTGDMQPLGYAKITFYVKNLKGTTVQGAELVGTLTSPTGKVQPIDKMIPRMDPGEEQAVETTILFDKYQQSGMYTIDAQVNFQGEVTKAKQTLFVEAKPVMVTESEKSPILFGYTKKIKITNNGNTVGDQTVTESLSNFDSAFYTGEKSTLVSGNDYIWIEKNIQPGETRLVQYNIDYAPLAIFIIAVVALVWFYFTKYRTIRVRKYIVQRKQIVEGEEFTVAVEVTNAIGRAVDVEVRDFVPSVFDVKEAQGGPKPSKKKSHVGYELLWSPKQLKPGESRIFTYKIVPIFGVRGLIRLPKASVLFMGGKKELESLSLSPSIGVSEVPAEEQIWEKFFRRKNK